MIYSDISRAKHVDKNTKIGAFCDIGADVEIGEGCNIQCHCSLSNGVKIGNRVFIGPGVRFANDKYLLGIHAVDSSHLQPPIVEDDVRIGMGALIGAGVRLKRGCWIGQGANVLKDVESWTCVVGNPARFYADIGENEELVFGRKCLVLHPTIPSDVKKCKKFGSGSCNWNLDAMVECAYMLGDKDIDVNDWVG